MSDTAIKVEGVSKKFSRDLNHLMVYGLEDIGRNICGLPARTSVLRKGEFWAVDDVSFELKRGETLGLIGPNGSGKTTMLKMLNGIFMPDKGRITINGRVGALIQVGAGFHPLLTGRENIYINATILGMTRKEIDRKFDQIVAFADIGDFLDTPVGHYSSGMFVRLGFSVAIHCEPDILLVDEILSVGDISFRRKCGQRIRELRANKITTIFVSHDMGTLRHICDRGVCFKKGQSVFSGSLDGAISSYMTSTDSPVTKETTARLIKQVKTPGQEQGVPVFHTGRPCRLEITIESPQKLNSPVIGLSIIDNAGETVIGTNTRKSNFAIDSIEGTRTFGIDFPFVNLIPGNYSVSVGLFDEQMGMIDLSPNALMFFVHSENYSSGTIFSDHNWSILQT